MEISMKDIEERIAWTMQYCQHYDPSGIFMIGGVKPHGHCKAGVNYQEQFGGAPNCCLDGNKCSEEEQLARCPKWLRKTREQGIARHNEIEKAMAQMNIVGVFLKTWRTWSKKNRVAKAEIVECPVCKGRLHLSQAAYNGHVHGKCETVGCVSWME